MKKLILEIKAVPNAPKTELSGFMENGVLKIKVKAAPEKGKANKELIHFLAELFQVKKREVLLTSGAASRLKRFKIVGKEQTDLQKIIDSIGK